MADRLPPFWDLQGFRDVFDAWNKAESPSDEVADTVARWIAECFEEPYEGMKRDPSVPNRWWAVIPGTADADDNYVLCSYFIFEDERVVLCQKIEREHPI